MKYWILLCRLDQFTHLAEVYQEQPGKPYKLLKMEFLELSATVKPNKSWLLETREQALEFISKSIQNDNSISKETTS